MLTPIERIMDGAVLVAGERIVDVGTRVTVRRPAGATVIDCGDATIVPGFVDVHIHGSGGFTAMDGPDAVAAVSRFIVRHGVTSWLPTLTPRATIAEMTDHIRGVTEAIDRTSDGADVAGIHLEGPFLNPKRPGAIRAEWFHPPSTDLVEELIRAGNGHVRLMTLAPELPRGLDVVRRLVARGVTASIGHSDATSEQAEAAIVAGVRHATHAYNAMRGLHHRDPGVVGAMLASNDVRAELIADGVHVHPTAMRALVQAKGTQHVMAITDAVAPAGLGDGAFEFDGRPITVRAGQATLADGTIAGSVSTFDGNLRRLVTECGVPLADAIAMGSLVPAASVGLAARKGYLSGGRDADLVALDANLQVRLTICRGNVVYDNR
jgi:N-acetylglucosamine-6-phosphate deacetylase